MLSSYQIRGYARGRSSPARGVPVGDARSTISRSDPTGTLRVRKDLARNFNRGWSLTRQAVARTVGADDSFGLSSHGPGSFQALASSTGQLQVFNTWLGNLQDRVFENLRPALQEAVERGYAMGAAQAQARVGKRLQRLPGAPGVALASAIQDLSGIASAVTQQSSRFFADSVLRKTHPRMVARGVNFILGKTGVGRTNLLAGYAVVRAHAAGTLDTLEALGVRYVGVIPERLPGNIVHDHVQDAPVELARIRLKVPRPRQKPSVISRARRVERKLERAFPGLVNVITADDRACLVCKRIEKEGPYTINEARTLIPAHPACRCAFAPYEGSTQ